MPEKCVMDMVKCQKLAHSLLLSTKCREVDDLITCKRFSKLLQRLLRVTVLCEEICVEIQIPH